MQETLRRTTTALAGGLAISMALALPAHATLTFSEVAINSQTAVTDANPDTLRDETGGPVELSATGSQNLAFGSGGAVVVKPTSDDVFARASLSTAELKARSMLGFGTDAFGSLGSGLRNGSASAISQFGDSFRTFADNQPFLWSDGDTATFNFSVTGSTSVPSGIDAPATFPTGSNGEPINFIYSQLQLVIYQAGAIDVLLSLRDFDFGSGSIEDFLALNQQLNDRILFTEGWYFGDTVLPDDFNVPAERMLGLTDGVPTEVSYAFNPDGDFDWLLLLDTNVFLDASLQNVAATMDFASTVTASYVGPDGSETRSGSGLFPGTVALAVDDVPEPAGLGLLLAALLPLGYGLRRRRALSA